MTPQSKTPEDTNADPVFDRAVEHEARQIVRMCPIGQEPVLTILRGHLLAEHYLERVIAVKLPRGDRIIHAGLLSFAQKLNLVESLDALPDRLIQSLKGLNGVRNSCAHEMDREITMPDVERIGRPHGAEFTSLRREHYTDVSRLLTRITQCIGRDLSGHVYFLEREAAEGFKKKSPAEGSHTVKTSGGNKSLPEPSGNGLPA